MLLMLLFFELFSIYYIPHCLYRIPLSELLIFDSLNPGHRYIVF